VSRTARPSSVRAGLAVALLTVGAAACGGSDTPAASTASPATTTPTAAASTPAAAATTPAPAATTPATTPAPKGTITVFAAASLTGTFTELGKQFQAANPGTTVRFSFGASSTLAQQILAGAPADVFASASAATMAQVTAGGDATGPVTFAKNTAEIAVAPGSTGRVTSVADLARSGVKVALCQPQVPCGAIAAKVFTTAGVTVKPVTLGLDVKATLTYVSSGDADAAVVYVTDVRAAGSSVRGVAIPAAQNASTAYPIATVKASKNAALAARFQAYVLSGDGQRVLTAAGFSGP